MRPSPRCRGRACPCPWWRRGPCGPRRWRWPRRSRFLRRGDDQDGATGALDELDRHAAEDAAGDPALAGAAADDDVGLLLLRVEQDAARDLARADVALRLDAGRAEAFDE